MGMQVVRVVTATSTIVRTSVVGGSLGLLAATAFTNIVVVSGRSLRVSAFPAVENAEWWGLFVIMGTTKTPFMGIIEGVPYGYVGKGNSSVKAIRR
jgi:hypothetical protein